ncbi:class I SAM-dependent methyltransferase [Pseudovibrio sp. WM33]|uniref:class I SAM-dependent methyltransferase n=1 Tax=Pseudovibrio sp. WM33 TaxID=1735585 RepID=UPI0007AE9950|nr:class I SAM-dependent methyltransferase [Pseudovibrio sp. WM33]KZL23232.1 putative methyltransferase YcgJ [Pseudovibrio sp. WM33]
MQNSAGFWDKHAPGYVARPMKDVASYEKAMDRVRSYLTPEQEVLELGCGSGATAMLLAKHVKHMTASDISGKMIEFGREKAWDDGVENVSFVHAPAGGSVLDGKTYDVVMAYNVIHLIKGPADAINQVQRLVKPGGLLISKTPCLGDSAFYWRWLINVMRLVGYAPYVTYFKQVELGRQIEQAGFKIVETGNYPASPMGRFIVALKT